MENLSLWFILRGAWIDETKKCLYSKWYFYIFFLITNTEKFLFSYQVILCITESLKGQFSDSAVELFQLIQIKYFLKSNFIFFDFIALTCLILSCFKIQTLVSTRSWEILAALADFFTWFLKGKFVRLNNRHKWLNKMFFVLSRDNKSGKITSRLTWHCFLLEAPDKTGLAAAVTRK